MDDLMREKFENFSPSPPGHLWAGIENEIDKKTAFIIFMNNWRSISAIILVLLLLTFGALYISINESAVPSSFTDPSKETLTSATLENEAIEEKISETTDKTEIEFRSAENNTEKNISVKTGATIVENHAVSNPTFETISIAQVPLSNETALLISGQKRSPGLESMQPANTTLTIPFDLRIKPQEHSFLLPEKETKTTKKGSWNLGFYFSPEVLFKDFDSVRLLTTYSFNVEPTYYFNGNWFLRFGAGISSMRDRGFANLDYISNDFMGEYEDVYDVTFDSVDGKLQATYYTELTEVWDSIRHLTVTEATNQYLYLQTPLLLGYTLKSEHFNWFFYAGPALNFLIKKYTEMSVDNAERISIIDLENRLPDRSPYFFQLWVGAGVEYKAGKHLSLALEPNFRYYFSGIYDNPAYNSGFSGFAMRFGIIYKIF